MALAPGRCSDLTPAQPGLIDSDQSAPLCDLAFENTFVRDLFYDGHRREEPGDDVLVRELFEALAETETDFTLFFRNLGAHEPNIESSRPAFYADGIEHPRMAAWLQKYASSA